MAVYAYPYHHCIVWEAELGRRKLPFGQFRENLTIAGLGEDSTRVGDLFQDWHGAVPDHPAAHPVPTEPFASAMPSTQPTRGARQSLWLVHVVEIGNCAIVTDSSSRSISSIISPWPTSPSSRSLKWKPRRRSPGRAPESRIPQRCALLACSRYLPGRPLIEVATFHELVKLQSIAQSGGLTISLAGTSARPLRSFLQESGRSQAEAQA